MINLKKSRHFTKIVSNNNGAALLMVLIVISLIMFFSTVIMNSILSQGKQNQIVAEDYRAVHLAELGTDFTQLKLAEYVDDEDFESSNETFYFHDLFNMLNEEAKDFTVDEDFPERKFMISKDDRKKSSYEMTDDGANVFLKVTGVDDETEKDIYVTYRLRFATSGGSLDDVDDWDSVSDEFPPPPENPDHNCTSGLNDCDAEEGETVYIGEGETEIKNNELTTGDFYSDGKISVSANAKLTILGSGVFNGMYINPSKHTEVLIRDHAYFNSQLVLKSNKHGMFNACGSARFKQGFNYGGQFGVRQHLISDEPAYFDKVTVSIGGDALFKKGLFFNHHKHGVLQVGGDITIYVNQNPDEYFKNISNHLHVVGDLTIHGSGKTIVNPSGDYKVDQLNNPSFANVCADYPLPETGGSGDGDTGADLVDGEY
ncbi:hypothetical protein ACFFJI_05415 [Allobacillus sp. GCM10007491]|uniref:Uncharacterized protein n=1 Tax=Allobacillus saliphilus TaxID=2912308 RepID=A0A941HTH6_9BACI|nr:hypothetical protein [Allobacillus saliphilus]MBR7554438.1 hypothetical protein [Allobacillus saliphilus]